MLRASGGCFYRSCESNHPRSSDESSRNCIMMFGFKLSELLHYLYVYVYIIQQVLNLRPATHPHKEHFLTQHRLQEIQPQCEVGHMLMCSLYVTRTSNPRYQYYIVGVSSRSSRVAWARTSIHVQEYGTRHHHDIHLTPYYFSESVLEQSLQPRCFSNFSHRAAVEVGVCRQSVSSTAVPLVSPTPTLYQYMDVLFFPIQKLASILLPPLHNTCLLFVKIYMYLDMFQYIGTSIFGQMEVKYFGTEGVHNKNFKLAQLV